MTNERRRRPRTRFRQPMPGSAGPTRIAVLDASPLGLGIAHQEPLPGPGGVCRIELQSNLGPIRLDCTIVRTVARKTWFQTGVAVLAADRQSVARLETLADEEDR